MIDQIARSSPKPAFGLGKPAHLFVLTLVMVAFAGGTRAISGGQQATSQSRSDSAGPAAVQESGSSFSPGTAGLADDVLISRGDMLDVAVFDEPQLSCQCVVGPSGTITLALLKPVKAVGLTTSQLAEAVANNLRQAELLSHPQVTVTIRSAPSSVVTVEGAVRNPQPVAVLGQAKFSTVLSQAGGLADEAGDTATVYRGALAIRRAVSEGQPSSQTRSIDLKKVMSGTDPGQDLDLLPGDRVVVERAGVFYVLGEVNRPGGYNLKNAREEVSVLQALAIAGDVTSVAKKTKAFLLRKDSRSPGGRSQINLNLTAILARRAPDEQLHADDILYIPVSGKKRTVHGITSTAQAIIAPTTTALIVYRR